MLQEGVNSLLAAAPTIQAILGTPATRSDGSTGIWPVTVPIGKPLPALVYMKVGGHEINSLDGRGELRVSRIQISPYAETYADVANLCEAAKDVLCNFQGKLDDGTEVDSMFLVLELDAYESTPKIFHAPFDVEIQYRNATA
jgi:hypothetical protein